MVQRLFGSLLTAMILLGSALVVVHMLDWYSLIVLTTSSSNPGFKNVRKNTKNA
jgi:hypothetical protein